MGAVLGSCGLLICLVLLAGCAAAGSTPTPAATTRPTPAPMEEAVPTSARELRACVLYPSADSEVEMGQPVKFTVQVSDTQGSAVSDALVTITVYNPGGETVVTLPTVHGGQGVYRSDYWPLPHCVAEGVWGIVASAEAGSARGTCSGSFRLRNSTSEALLAKYGFWLDAPSLRGSQPVIHAEKGDARNGMVRWGGGLPPGTQHFAPGFYVEVHWRAGDYGLGSAEAARRFVLEEIGQLRGIRRVGPVEPLRFQHWDGWRVEGFTFKPQELEWIVLYAPEVDRTYTIATEVLLAPEGINPHAALRDSFAVFPEIEANGVAPEPLPDLLPGPTLISPPLAARFKGTEQPIVLQWQPLKDLAEDEYYEVALDYYYREAHPIVTFLTRETSLTVPETLYHTPNCQVFNWTVTLKRQTGLADDGLPIGEALTHPSLYWYFWWQYPPRTRPFPPLCPYTHRD